MFFLRNPELYNFKDIISYKELFTSYTIRELNYNANFELNDIIENQDIILKDSFSLNPCATKFFFELIHFDNLISPARLSLNKTINESFLIKFFEYYLENKKKLEEFDILYAIQNCNFNTDADLCEIFKNIIDIKPILLPVFLNKTANLESYKKNFRRLNNENVFKSFNLNFVWDVELFEMLLLLLNPKRLNNYRFFSNVLDKILISKDILTKYGNVLNGGFTYEKKIYSSWSEGSIYRDVTIDFPSMIIEHPDLSRDEINDFLNSHHYIKY